MPTRLRSGVSQLSPIGDWQRTFDTAFICQKFLLNPGFGLNAVTLFFWVYLAILMHAATEHFMLAALFGLDGRASSCRRLVYLRATGRMNCHMRLVPQQPW